MGQRTYSDPIITLYRYKYNVHNNVQYLLTRRDVFVDKIIKIFLWTSEKTY